MRGKAAQTQHRTLLSHLPRMNSADVGRCLSVTKYFILQICAIRILYETKPIIELGLELNNTQSIATRRMRAASPDPNSYVIPFASRSLAPQHPPGNHRFAVARQFAL